MPAQGNTRLGVTLVGSGIHNNSDRTVHVANCCTCHGGDRGSSLVSSTYVRRN
jgi:hypothetical protein